MNKNFIALGIILLLTACNSESNVEETGAAGKVEETGVAGDVAATRQSLALGVVGSLNRSQEAYHTENSKFAQSISELGMPVSGEEYYEFSISVEGSDSAFVMAKPKENNLKAYTGGVLYNSGSGLFVTITCEANEPGAEPKPPSLSGDQATCGEGSTKI